MVSRGIKQLVLCHIKKRSTKIGLVIYPNPDSGPTTKTRTKARPK